MKTLDLHIADATLAAGVRKSSRTKVWPYVLAIGYAFGILTGLAIGTDGSRPATAAGSPVPLAITDSSEDSQ